MSDALNTPVPAVQAEANAQIKSEITPEVNKVDGAPEGAIAKVADALAAAKKEEPISNKKKYKLKDGNIEEEMELDLGNDEEVKKHLQKGRAADRRMQEAAEIRKAAMDFIQQLRTNPRQVLSDPNLGLDIKKLAEEIINDEIKEMEKPPEQREKEKLQKELEDLKKQAKDHQEAAQKAEFDKLQAEQERILESEISVALDTSGLPKTPRTVKAMAEMMLIALQNNIDLSVKDVVPLVKNTTINEFKEIVSSLSDDQLENFLGKEILGRLRKKNVAKSKAIDTANSIRSTGVESKKVETPVKKMSIKEFLGA